MLVSLFVLTLLLLLLSGLVTGLLDGVDGLTGVDGTSVFTSVLNSWTSGFVTCYWAPHPCDTWEYIGFVVTEHTLPFMYMHI